MRFPILTTVISLAISSLCYAGSELSYTYDGKTYTGSELPPAIRTQLYELDLKLNEQRQQIVDQYILETWLRQEAKAQGKTPEAFASSLLEVPRPDEKALKAFYEENWERIQQPYEDAKPEIESIVWNQQQQAKVEELIKRIGSEKNYKVSLPTPDAPVFTIKTEGYAVKGNPNAKVTIVEFSDYQCPHCKHAAEALHKVLETHGEQFRLIHRDLPINPTGISRKVAEGAVCAGQQDKYWAYHDLAFAQQDKLTNDSPLALAKELKLDEDKFKTCLTNPDTAAAVVASEEEARQLGITSTPTFFINGKPLTIQFDVTKEVSAAIETANKALMDSGSETTQVEKPTEASSNPLSNETNNTETKDVKTGQ